MHPPRERNTWSRLYPFATNAVWLTESAPPSLFQAFDKYLESFKNSLRTSYYTGINAAAVGGWPCPFEYVLFQSKRTHPQQCIRSIAPKVALLRSKRHQAQDLAKEVVGRVNWLLYGWLMVIQLLTTCTRASWSQRGLVCVCVCVCVLSGVAWCDVVCCMVWSICSDMVWCSVQCRLCDVTDIYHHTSD